MAITADRGTRGQSVLRPWAFRPSIDVRQWHREARLYRGQQFSCSWTRGEEPAGNITFQVELSFSLIGRAIRALTTGNLSSNGCRSGSRPATSVVYALGLSVPSTATGATGDGERSCFTALASYLRAAGAMACLMRANRKWRASVAATTKSANRGDGASSGTNEKPQSKIAGASPWWSRSR